METRSKTKLKLPNKNVEPCLQKNSENISIDILNDDCLKHIFTFLPIRDKIRIERVCKKWRKISKQSWYTTKELHLHDFAELHKISHKQFKNVLTRCGKFLEYLTPSALLSDVTNGTIRIIAKFCSNLRSITLKTTKKLNIEILAEKCTKITEFNLTYHNFDLKLDLNCLFKEWKNLERLKITGGFDLFSNYLFELPTPPLHTLIFENCGIDKQFSSVLKKYTNLKCLVIEKCVGIQKCTIETISKYCINLRELQINYGTFSDGKDVIDFTHLISLQIFKMKNNDKLLDIHIVNMVLYCQQLTCVDITGCSKVTDTGLNAIATLPKLEKLCINLIDQITNFGLRKIRNLKEFECRGCTLITDDSLKTIIESSPQLQLLNLIECSNITYVTIHAIHERHPKIIIKR